MGLSWDKPCINWCRISSIHRMCSMVLEYLPTCSPWITHFCRYIYYTWSIWDRWLVPTYSWKKTLGMWEISWDHHHMKSWNQPAGVSSLPMLRAFCQRKKVAVVAVIIFGFDICLYVWFCLPTTNSREIQTQCKVLGTWTHQERGMSTLQRVIVFFSRIFT